MKKLLLLLAGSALLICGERASAASEELRLLTYNIHMWEPGMETLSTIIEKSNADIIALSEAWNGDKNEALAKKLGYRIAYGGKETTPPLPKRAHWINDH